MWASLFAALFALLQYSEARVAFPATHEWSDQRVLGRSVESVLVGLDGPLRRVQFRPIYLTSCQRGVNVTAWLTHVKASVT